MWLVLKAVTHLGPNWLGTICPGGPTFWGPFVHGDRLSRGINFVGIVCLGTESGGPEFRGSNGFWTKCVAAVLKASYLSPIHTLKYLFCSCKYGFMLKRCFVDAYRFIFLKLRPGTRVHTYLKYQLFIGLSALTNRQGRPACWCF